LARGLRRGGWAVAVQARTEEAERRAARDGFRRADEAAWAAAQLCLLCVPDAAVADAARQAAPRLSSRAGLVHCAGALTLRPLAEAGAPNHGSFHPLCAISDAHDPLAGSAVALAATDARLLRRLRGLARALGMRPIEVPEAGRAAYHAGAVLAAGGMVALAAAAVEALAHAGVERGAAVRALLGLMKSALRGAERRGLAHGLTGPVARGDVATVREHLRALPAHLVPLYRELSRQALRLAPALDERARVSLEEVLR
jgi:predicted short-subunit dehydrogenase-like oxidoreductase (DUF2520 family)